MGAQPPAIRPYSSADFAWASEVLSMTGGRYQVRRGRVIDVAQLAGLVSERHGQPAALVTYARPGPEVLEISAVAAAPFDDELVAGLITACIVHRQPTCRRVYSICSNAQFDIQRLLQREGFRLAATRPGSIAAAADASSKPVIRQFGGLPVRDEIEFERLFTPA